VVTVAGQLLLLQLLVGIASSGYRVLTVVVSDRGRVGGLVVVVVVGLLLLLLLLVWG
jgi:hypothetical protein